MQTIRRYRPAVVTIVSLARLFGIDRRTAARAIRERRLVERGMMYDYTPLEPKPALRRCEACHIVGNRQGKARICRTCWQAGKRWCTYGQHVILAQQYKCGHCHDCRNEYRRSLFRTVPPDGYIRVDELAPRLGYSHAGLNRLIRNGYLAGLIWTTPGGHRYIKDLDEYPPYEK